MMILGIDPGLQGALCFRLEDSVIFELMPVTDGELDLDQLNHLIRAYADEISCAYLELQSIRPMQTGQFKIGRNFGCIEGMLAALRIPTRVVRPQEWSANYDHRVKEKDPAKRKKLIKIARRAIAAELYPGLDLRASEKSSTPHEGLVDALLIADYGFNMRTGKWLSVDE